MSWLQLKPKRLSEFGEHATLPEAQQETTDRTAAWLDTRMAGLARSKLWKISKCLPGFCLIQAQCFCVLHQPLQCLSLRKRYHRLEWYTHTPGHNKHLTGKTHRILFDKSSAEGLWGSVTRKDHLFLTARAAWVGSTTHTHTHTPHVFEDDTILYCIWGTNGWIIKNTCASSYSSMGARGVWRTLLNLKTKVKVHLIC